MTGLYLLTGTFMVLFFLFLIYFVVYTERRRVQQENINKERFEHLSGQINETQSLFKNEVTNILTNFKKILP